MNITENFLVNTKNFENIVETLKTTDELPDKITNEYMEILGYSNPSDLLVLHLFKDLGMLEEDGTPTTLFSRFREDETTHIALARGTVFAYHDLFENNLQAHKLKVDELVEEFRKIFESGKSDLILKYMANTFNKLVSYSGQEKIDEIVREEFESVSEVEKIIKNASQQENSSLDEGTEEAGEVAIAESEERGNTDIEEFISSDTDFDEMDSEEEISIDDIEDQKEDPFDFEEDSEEQEDQLVSEEPDDSEEESELTDSETISQETVTQNSNSMNGSAKTAKPHVSLPADESIVGKAFVKKAELLYKLERFEEALPTFEEIIDRYKTSDDPFFEEHVNKAIINRASLLEKMDRFEEALPALDEVYERFEDSDDPTLYDHASDAIVHIAKIMEKLDESENILPVYDKMIERLGDSDKYESALDEAVINRTELILEKGDSTEILDALTIAIDRFEDSASDYEEFLKKAMYKKAELLEELGQDEKALKAYDAFLEKFGD